MQACTHASINSDVHTCPEFVHARVRAHASMRMHTNTHTHTRAHTHTHKHTRLHSSQALESRPGRLRNDGTGEGNEINGREAPPVCPWGRRSWRRGSRNRLPVTLAWLTLRMHALAARADGGQPLDRLRAGRVLGHASKGAPLEQALIITCLLYTSPSPRDQRGSRMPSSA